MITIYKHTEYYSYLQAYLQNIQRHNINTIINIGSISIIVLLILIQLLKPHKLWRLGVANAKFSSLKLLIYEPIYCALAKAWSALGLG